MWVGRRGDYFVRRDGTFIVIGELLLVMVGSVVVFLTKVTR